jgi:hypothetical protein
MPTFSREWYEDYKERHAKKPDARSKEEEVPAGAEAALHDKIIEHCRDRGWVYFHGSTARATHRTLGEPDFVVFLPDGRVLLVECKTRTGKLSTEQLALHAALGRLGHCVHVVRSLREFIQLATLKTSFPEAASNGPGEDRRQ